MMRFESKSEQDTFSFAYALAGSARPGDIFALSGDLGAGKTVFAKGFAKGLGVEQNVLSPTFTLLKCYEGSSLWLYHFDAYRIADPLEMEEIGCEEYFYGTGVTLVEWPERIYPLIPEYAKWIRISKDPLRGDFFRLIEID